MLEPLLVILRAAQCAFAAALLGAPLFALYALPREGPASAAALGWPRRVIAWSAGGLTVAAVAALLVQTMILAGSIEAGLKPDSLVAVVTTLKFGPAALVRAVAAAAALPLVLSRRPSWILAAGFGAVAAASLAWMGHGPSTQGAAGVVHLGADVLHVLAAGIWLGALPMFLLLLRQCRREPEALAGSAFRALHGFAGVGAGSVATLLATGLVNSWFLVGPTRIAGLWTTPYGLLLSAKLVLFAAMLALAAAHRFRMTPALGAALDADPGEALAALRRSVALETALGLCILGLVGWLGFLAPVSAR